MKNLVIGSILLLGLSSQALAVPSFPVTCTGRYMGNNNLPMLLTVSTTETTEQLKINHINLASKSFISFPPRVFQVTQAAKMFPVSYIDAISNQTPVDGDLEKVYLSVQTEVIAPTNKYPAKLTVDAVYEGRNGPISTHKVYDLTCDFVSQN